MRQFNNLCALPEELQIQIFVKLSYLDNTRLKTVCKSFQDLVGGNHFQSAVEKFGHFHKSLSPVMFFWRNEGLEWIGYDDTLQQWNRLPSLQTLDPKLLFRRSPRQTGTSDHPKKPFLVSTSGGLVLCTIVSKNCNVECIIVCNPVTQHKKILPPLNFRDKPEFARIIYDTSTKAYHVIVVDQKNFYEWWSMRPKIYDSRTGTWEVIKEYIPQSSYKLKRLIFQSCAVVNDIFFCITKDSYYSGDSRPNFLAYNVRRGEWLNPWNCSFPSDTPPLPGWHPITVATTNGHELVEYKNRLVLMYKRSYRGSYSEILKCFAALKYFQSGDEPEPVWSEVNTICCSINRRGHKTGECDLRHDIHSPCTAADTNKCAYVVAMNTVVGAARKCNVESNTEQTQLLPAPPVLRHNDEVIKTLNPWNFSFEPNFTAAV